MCLQTGLEWYFTVPIRKWYTRVSQKALGISLTSTVWCTTSSYSLDRVLVAICTCKFCRGCAMRFGGSGDTSGRQGQWFLHHDNAGILRSNSSPRKSFLSPLNHGTLRISLRVTSGCSLLWKWSSKGHVSQPCRTSESNATVVHRKFQGKPPASASKNGRMDEPSVCVCVCLFVFVRARAQGSYFQGG
jgi:hypothetical protein